MRRLFSERVWDAAFGALIAIAVSAFVLSLFWPSLRAKLVGDVKRELTLKSLLENLGN